MLRGREHKDLQLRASRLIEYLKCEHKKSSLSARGRLSTQTF